MEDRRTQRTAIIIVSLSSFITPLMLSGVNVAIPRIAEGLQADAILLSWIPTAYLLTSAVCLLPFGKLADMHGRKRIYLAGIIMVTLGSVLASLAHSVEVLIAFRIVQGIGSGMLFATGAAIITSIFPRERRGAALGVTVSAVYLGLTCGPLIGGWATAHFSWRSVFLIHVPLALVIIFLAVTRLRGEWKDDREQRYDFSGTLAYGSAIIALMYGVSRLPEPLGMLLAGIGIAGLVVFIRIQKRIASPLIDVHLFFSNRLFTFSCMAALISYSATFAISYLMSLYLQYIKGLPPQSAGMVMMVQPLMMALFSPFAGRLSDRHEPRYLASAGMAMTAGGLLLLSFAGAATPIAYAVASLMVVGLGVALFSSPNINAIMGSVEKRSVGTAAGVSATMRVWGQMFSMGIVTVVFAMVLGPVHITPESYPALLTSVQTSFLAAGLLCASGIYLSFSRGDVHRRSGPAL